MYRSGLSRARIAARVRAEPAWITAQGRFPKTKAAEAHERSLAAWLSRRRREAADNTLHPSVTFRSRLHKFQCSSAQPFLPRRLHLSEHTGDARPGTLVYIHVDDVDAAARAVGVTEIDDMPWGRDFEVADPDGNRLRIGTADVGPA